MIKEKYNIEKLCLFSANDYHFEMVSLPYINEQLKKKKRIVIMTENNLEKSVYKLIEMINLSIEEKEKLKSIDWENNDLEKLKILKKYNNENEDVIIFIRGTENYIENINENIRICIDNNNFEIINCYNIDEVQESAKNIVKKYNKVLSLSGVKK